MTLYHPVALELEDNDNTAYEDINTEDILHLLKIYHVKTRRWRTLFFVAMSLTILFGISTAGLWIRIYTTQDALMTNMNSMKDMNLEDIKSFVEYEQRVFAGDLLLNRTSREIYHDVPAGEQRYFGDPAMYPDIDTNWKHLLKDELFAMTDEEAEPFNMPTLIRFEDGKYHASLSVIHGLHCLNAIRIHLDKDYYMMHGGVHQDGLAYPPGWSRAHMSHCLDQIRQMLQCSSDLSINPVHIEKEIRINRQPSYIATGATHTCIKFDRILDWLKARREKYGSLSEFS